jgi:uncharacterized RDD family membrane protein YckC
MNLAGQELDLATLGERYWGQVLDSVVAFLAGALAAQVLPISDDHRWMVACGVWAAYTLLSDAFPKGQSLGKVVKHSSVRDQRTGLPCSLRQSIVRNITLVLLGPIDWLFIFGRRHQRLGDMAAGTVVVRV